MLYEVKHFSELTSTNDKALELLASGAPEGTVVIADQQNAGRGRQGRRWVSSKGNLFATIVLKPEKPLQVLSELAFVAALAVGRSLKAIINPGQTELQYKWPNDVLLNTQKVCGILIESYSSGASVIPEGCVVGIGVNITSHPEFTIFPASYVNNFAKTPTTAATLAPLVLDHFSNVYALWKNGGFLNLKGELMKNIFGLGRVIHASSSKGLVYGVFEGLSDDGGVILKDVKGDQIIIRSSEVTFD